MECEKCPFKGIQVRGEGSRVLREYYIEKKTNVEGVVFRTQVTERDNEGQYDVVCVGMAPAREEVREGRPFVGASGQILRKTLEQMDIKEFYITNVLLCPIPEDAPEEVIQDAISKCRPVAEEILAHHPKLTIALGDLPLHVLADVRHKIKEIEGRVIPSKVGPLLPITHPAYYWRRSEEFFDFIECMRVGIRFLKGTYIQCGEPEWMEVTAGNLGQVKEELNRYGEVGVDLETTGFFAYGWDPCKILEMGLAPTGGKAYIVPGEMVEEFKELLERKKCIFWNAQFDSAFLKVRGITPNIFFDGMLAHYSMDERPYSHGLKKVARIYLGADDWGAEVEGWIPKRKTETVDFGAVPKEVRYKYLAKDATRTYQLKQVLVDEVNTGVFWSLLMPACRMFVEIENKGVRVDPVKIMDMEPRLEQSLLELGEKIHRESGTWVNPLSPQQVMRLLYDTLEIPVDPYFGRTSNKVALAQYADQYPIVQLILDYREIAKLKGTYIEGLAKHVDRTYHIHPSIKLFAAVSGRLGSENPSIMNIKALDELKQVFLPHYGSLLGSFDIKGNELRWYYLYSGDEVIGAIFKNGGDPHDPITKVVYGENYSKHDRTMAKAVVFGRLYGRSRKAIEYQVGSEVLDALMAAVDGTFPKVRDYRGMIMKEIREKGYLTSYWGRRRRFGLVTPEKVKEIEREGTNFIPQSGGTDMMLLSMLHLWSLKDKWEIWPFWPIHDNILIDIPTPDVLPEIKKELERYSTEMAEGKVPFVWDADWGIDFSMRKEV